MGSRVVALGHHQPTGVLKNEALTKMVDTTDEWIRSRVGIQERRIAAEDESVADMAAAAAAKALANSGLAATDIDLVLVATCTATDRSPNVAARVAARLGITGAAAMDVNSACSGFAHALAVADLTISSDSASVALVVGSEKLSAFTDWTDRTTCVLVGDGAGAMVVAASDRPEISPVVWGSVPELGHTIRIEPPTNTFSQEGQSVYRWATTTLPPIVHQICDRAGIAPAEVGGVILHQANLRIIEAVVRKLGMSNAVVARDVVESGNTSAASIPLAFSKLVQRGELTSGVPVLLFGFGGGLAYAGQIVRCP